MKKLIKYSILITILYAAFMYALFTQAAGTNIISTEYGRGFLSLSNSAAAQSYIGDDTTTPFTMVLIPDTQYYASGTPSTFSNQFTWLTNNISTLNIKTVIGLGDIVDAGNSNAMWIVASNSWQKLYNNYTNVAFVAPPGNHDYDMDYTSGFNTQGITNRSLTNYNSYFPLSLITNKQWYGGAYEADKMENVWIKQEIGKYKFIIFGLEFGPRESVCEWVKDVCATNEDRMAIIATHAYMYDDDTRIGGADLYSPTSYNIVGSVTDGEDMWAIFKDIKNLIAIFSGHEIQTGIGKTVTSGTYGNQVLQTVSDYQIQPNNGNGWLRYITFYPSVDAASVKTYSTTLDQYWTDEANQFKFNLEQNAGAGIASTKNFNVQLTNLGRIYVGENGYVGQGNVGLRYIQSDSNTVDILFTNGVVYIKPASNNVYIASHNGTSRGWRYYSGATDTSINGYSEFRNSTLGNLDITSPTNKFFANFGKGTGGFHVGAGNAATTSHSLNANGALLSGTSIGTANGVLSDGSANALTASRYITNNNDNGWDLFVGSVINQISFNATTGVVYKTGVTYPISVITNNYTVSTNDQTIIGDQSVLGSTAIILTLPTTTVTNGRTLQIRSVNTNGVADMLLTNTIGLIYGNATTTATNFISISNNFRTFKKYSTNWYGF